MSACDPSTYVAGENRWHLILQQRECNSDTLTAGGLAYTCGPMAEEIHP